MTRHTKLQQSNIHARSIGHTTDDSSLVSMRCENVNSFLGLSLIHGKHHSDTHVIDIEHLTMLDIAMLLQETENRKNLPSSLLHMNTLTLLKDTRDVLIESAAGDVGNTMNVTVPDDIQNLFHINSGRGQCYLSERFVSQFRINLVKIESCIRENLADKTETIGMNTGRSDSHEDITHLTFVPSMSLDFSTTPVV